MIFFFFYIDNLIIEIIVELIVYNHNNTDASSIQKCTLKMHFGNLNMLNELPTTFFCF